MRASPAFHVALIRFGVWRSAVGLLALAAAAALLSWLLVRDEPPTPSMWLAISAMICAIAALAYSLARVPVVQLHWDGQVWLLARERGAPVEPMGGDMTVALDLGIWMLLRFDPAACAAWTQPVWLPAQRRGIEAQWHALRCALYAPRPAPGAGATQK